VARRLVVLLDGTGNEICRNASNVLLLFRALDADEDQRLYYDPGVGTIAEPSDWARIRQRLRSLAGLVLGVGLDQNVLEAYAWLCREWREGDQIFLFGFSRGAYSAKVLAGLIHLMGLLPPDQLNLGGYLMIGYKQIGESGDLRAAMRWRLFLRSRQATIRFMGLWDSVSSLIAPRRDLLYLAADRGPLPFTRTNPSVEIFRHALAVDERRRMFRYTRWRARQSFSSDRYARDDHRAQDIREVWFAGVHSDIGGGYEENAGLSKFPFMWMAREASEAGLRFNLLWVDKLGLGAVAGEGVETVTGNVFFTGPDAAAEPNTSLAAGWWLAEAIPKRVSRRDWAGRLSLFDFYFPWGEPRTIAQPRTGESGLPLIHSSVFARIAARPDYRPVNLPAEFAIESTAGPPAFPPVEPPPYHSEGLLERLKRLFVTLPGGDVWAQLGTESLWLLPLLLACGWLGGFIGWDPSTSRLILFVLAAFPVLVLAEETLFRCILLKPPPDGASKLGPAMLSALLFALGHLLLARLCRWALADRCPPWIGLGMNPWFLLAVFALGLACARLVLAARSLWPAVALHWLVVVAWVALFGGPRSF